MQDPDPRVNGSGLQKLRDAGVVVDIGLGAVEAGKTMAGFFHRIATGRPLLTMGTSFNDTALVPEGFDARLFSDRQGLWLGLRSSESERVANAIRNSASARKVVDLLGRRGITSLFMDDEDEAARWFSPQIRSEKTENRS